MSPEGFDLVNTDGGHNMSSFACNAEISSQKKRGVFNKRK